MAGVDGVIPNQTTPGSGPLSRLARAQYAALIAMRWSMFRNGLRSFRGAAELGASIVVGVVFGTMGLGAAFGLGAGAYELVANDRWQFLPILFWIVFMLWQVVPVTIASFQPQFEFGGILRFPIGFSSFFLLSLIYGLVDVSTLLGGLCCLGIGVGIAIADPRLVGWAAVTLAVFALFNLLLSRAIFAWIERWLAQRRTREIVSALFLVAVLGMNFFNPAFRKEAGTPQISAQTRAEGLHYVRMAGQVQGWLPPGLAATGFRAGAHGDLEGLAKGFGFLGVFVFLAGGALAWRLRAEYRGENLGEAPSREKVEQPTRRWLLDGSGPIAAVMEKELRTIMRALNLLYALGAPLVFVFILAGLFRAQIPGTFSWGILISLAYAFVGFTQLIYNNLGIEGAGIQLLFLAPTSIRTVLLAKNLFHALLFVVDAVLVCILASLRYGTQHPETWAVVGSWILFALPVQLMAGNAFSIAMPYRINLGRIGRQKGAQFNALMSMLVQLAVLGIGAGTIALCLLYRRLWLTIPIFLMLAMVAVIVWLQTLPGFERMAHRRRERLLEVMVRAE